MSQSKMTTTDSTPGATEITPASTSLIEPRRLRASRFTGRSHASRRSSRAARTMLRRWSKPSPCADALRAPSGSAGDLVRAIKRQHSDAQLLKSTLASLKQLQAAG